MAHKSLSIFGVLTEPSLLAYTKYGIQATNTSGPAQESWREATAHASISIRGVLPEPSLLAYTKYGSRESAIQTLRPLAHYIAAHARFKGDFTHLYTIST